MIQIKNADVSGWEAAVRGMRNPMNSWHKADSFVCEGKECCIQNCRGCVGKNDLKLMQSLAEAGSEHRKFARFITVTCDMTAPLYWWKEFDTYKVGTVANSCSTMHKIHEKDFVLDDFSHEHLKPEALSLLEQHIIPCLNLFRGYYVHGKEKCDWWQMIQLLPSSYNQMRTVQMNYEVLANINRDGSRRNHKLDEWREFCKWVDALPYFADIFNQQKDGSIPII